jgi:mannose-1-phosphate guanylyltransferase
MSRTDRPKQLIPLTGGRSLLQIALERLEGLVPAANRWVCAGQAIAEPIFAALPQLKPEQFLGEPTGRDTLNAVGLAAAVLAVQDPDAVIAVFTADHLIEPVDQFLRIVDQGFALAERDPRTLVTFGIAPTGPATGYGYLELGDPIDGGARVVRQFKEKPEAAIADRYFQAGPEQYLWNSGMFVWRAATLLDCIGRYEPQTAEGLSRIAAAWAGPQRAAVLAETYPTLKKISVDFAVMEPASRDPSVRVAAIPMPLDWIDVGSWPSFAQTCPKDEQGNALAASRTLLEKTSRLLVVSSDPEHLIAVLGCEDLIVIHTPETTLICRADQAEAIKALCGQAGKQFGPKYI